MPEEEEEVGASNNCSLHLDPKLVAREKEKTKQLWGLLQLQISRSIFRSRVFLIARVRSRKLFFGQGAFAIGSLDVFED